MKTVAYDKTKYKPALHISICTGETAAGFKDMETGKFKEIMLIKNDKDLKKFMQTYGLKQDEITKEW